MYFSQKYGFSDIRQTIQTDNMGEDLSNRLESFIIDHFEKVIKDNSTSATERIKVSYEIYTLAMVRFFKESKLNILRDNGYRDSKDYIEEIMHKLIEYDWYTYYDFLEFIGSAIDNEEIEDLNIILTEENSGWRMNSNKKFIPVTNEVSLQAIDDVNISKLIYAQKHIQDAIGELSKREGSNSNVVVRESIDAVESALIEYAGLPEKGKNTLKTAIQKLKGHEEQQVLNFIKPFETLYGLASNTGIRHAGNSKTISLGKEEAIFLLTMCSALINYLSIKYEKQ